MRRPAGLLTGFLLLAGWLLAAAAPRAAAQQRRPRVQPTGSHGFRRMLYNARLKPLRHFADLKEDPGNKLLIVFGRLDIFEEKDDNGDWLIDLRSFLRRGGALLLASDDAAGTGMEQLRALFRLTIASGSVQSRSPQNPLQAYLGQSLCPYVLPVNDTHLIFRENPTGFPPKVSRIATNNPTYMQCGDPGLVQLARFDLAETLFKQGRGLTPLPPDHGYAFGNDGPNGKVLLLAGHGVFMNSQVYHSQNIWFANNCIKWFTKGDRKKPRTEVLFVEEGSINAKFDVPLKEIPLPPLPPLEKINRLLRQLEEENFFNMLVFAVAGHGADADERIPVGRARILKWLVVGLSVLLVLYALRRLWRAWQPLELAVPLVVSNVARTISTDSLLAQRNRDMIHDGNLWEAARELARRCFAEYAAAAPSFPPPQPEVVIKSGRPRHPALGDWVRRLWKLAYGPTPVPVAPARFHQILAEIDEVRDALARGLVTLKPPPATAPAHPRHAPGELPAHS
jgi:hypothetical protein